MDIFTRQLLDELAVKATASPRGRTNFNIHSSAADPVQRFFIVANRQSYFRPHRHLSKSELALVLRGQFELITFDEHGAVTTRHVVGGDADGFAYETPRATWHTLIARQTAALSWKSKKVRTIRPPRSSSHRGRRPKASPGSTFMEWLRTAQPGGPLHP